jgi:hypothetical protein
LHRVAKTLNLHNIQETSFFCIINSTAYRILLLIFFLLLYLPHDAIVRQQGYFLKCVK